jgi:hypothetical protein
MLNSRPPLSPFPLSLVADLAQEAVEKVGQDFLKALDWMLSNEGVVPKSKATLAELS